MLVLYSLCMNTLLFIVLLGRNCNRYPEKSSIQTEKCMNYGSIFCFIIALTELRTTIKEIGVVSNSYIEC